MAAPAHIHHFIPGTDLTGAAGLVHGSSGDQHDLVPLAEELAPAFDITDRTPVLADYIETILASHSATRAPIVIGFSNGAIMAAALLLTRPGLLAGAILFRPLSPFAYDLLHQLDGMLGIDPRRRRVMGLRLAERLTRAGAAVTHHVLPVGHSITSMESRDRERMAPRNDGPSHGTIAS